MRNQIDARKIKTQLSDDDIINLLDIIGIPLASNKNSEMIFYTGDHNEDAEDGSPKLYYYKETRIFRRDRPNRTVRRMDQPEPTVLLQR